MSAFASNAVLVNVKGWAVSVSGIAVGVGVGDTLEVQLLNALARIMTRLMR